MKIAMIGLRGIPSSTGGVETVVEHIAPAIAKMGHEVTVYCRNPYCTSKPKTWRGVKLKYLPTLNLKHTEAVTHTFLSTMNSLFKKYDIVHYHAMGNGLFSILPRIAGTKTVVTLHGLDYERAKWGLLAKMYLKLSERGIKNFSNQITSVSSKIQQYYKYRYRKNITYIPNGVDIIPKRKLNNLKKFHLEEDKFILFISRLVPEKEIHTLIKAFKHLNTDQKLVIAGDATHTNEYVKKIKALAKGDERIIFTGPLYGDDKTEAFSNCSFFVLPSTIEGMPIVLLEAMSFEKCPLVSDIQENLDVIENAGISFKVKDENDLSKKLQYMLSHKSLIERRGKECKKIVQKKYNWDVIAKQTLKVYEDVLNGKKS
jgi:glycosyltransferase involved in cell wall biosynthesis